MDKIKLSELIERLKRFQEKYGDVEIVPPSQGEVCGPDEFCVLTILLEEK